MDKNKIGMIAPVAVASILMLAVLAAISSTNQAFTAENKRTELTISATQNGPAKTVENEIHVPVKFSGRLASEGSGVAGVNIVITGGIETQQYHLTNAETDSSAHYSVVHDLPDHKKTYTIQAWAYPIWLPKGYEQSSATTTIQLPKLVVSLVKSPYVSKTVKMTFTAKLTGSNAIPPVNTPATGIARFELSSNGKVLNYHLSTTNLKGFKEADICEKMPVINTTTNKNTGEECDSVADLSMGKGKITSDDLYGHFEDSPLSDLIKSMRSGELYVNVDTQQHHYPATGEIFGQIRSG